MKIVIARYNENVNWTKQFQNVIIYNKGNRLDNTYNQIYLNNVGREGHTYYKYISDNYNNLDNYTIFLQGNPFDHSPNIIYNLNKCYQFENILHKYDTFNFRFLSETIRCSTFDIEKRDFPHDCSDIYNTWKRIFGENTKNRECLFGTGAQFIVSKETILKKPKFFYDNIVKILEYDIGPKEGYHIERFHKYIFS